METNIAYDNVHELYFHISVEQYEKKWFMKIVIFVLREGMNG